MENESAAPFPAITYTKSPTAHTPLVPSIEVRFVIADICVGFVGSVTLIIRIEPIRTSETYAKLSKTNKPVVEIRDALSYAPTCVGLVGSETLIIAKQPQLSWDTTYKKFLDLNKPAGLVMEVAFVSAPICTGLVLFEKFIITISFNTASPSEYTISPSTNKSIAFSEDVFKNDDTCTGFVGSVTLINVTLPFVLPDTHT